MIKRWERIALLALVGFDGITAVVSAPLLATTGFGMPAAWLLDHTPFTSYAIPGVLLGLVGVANLGAGLLALQRHPLTPPAATAAGLAMLGFEAYQLATLPYSWLQALYVALGALTAAIGIHGWLAGTPAGNRGRTAPPDATNHYR